MKKNIIIAFLGIAAALIAVAGVIHAKDARAQDAANGLVTQNVMGTEADVITAKFIRQFDIVSKINLNTDVFKNPAFQSLHDFSLPIPPEERGKTNPFAPL